MEQRAAGTLLVWAEPFTGVRLLVWAEPFTVLRLPKLFDLRADPYERADFTSNTYWDWGITNLSTSPAGVAIVAKYLETYKDFPPSQRPARSRSIRQWRS